jgi:hypothetical protein
MSREPNQGDGQKTYEAPQLKTISLRPEEAVLGHCKTSSSNGFVATPCASFICGPSVGS